MRTPGQIPGYPPDGIRRRCLPPNVSPVCDWSAEVNQHVVDFTDLSADPDGFIISWAWTFGDSGTSTSQNPQHTYAAPGTYSVTLTVTDNRGGVHQKTANVIAEPIASTDGPNDWYRPISNAEWAELALVNPKISVPSYYYLCQDTSGNLAEKNGGAALTTEGSGLLYDQTVTDWVAKHVGIALSSTNKGWRHAGGVGVNLSTTSFAMLLYLSVDPAGLTRYIGHMSTTGNAIRFSGAAPQLLATAGNAPSGSGSYGTTIHPFLWIHDNANSRMRLLTDLEQLIATHGALADGNKAPLHASGSATAELRCNLIAFWAGAAAEALDKTVIETLIRGPVPY